MEKIKTSRAGRRRWAELIRFLKTTMQTAKSERVRMSAALRLADILELREKREQLAMQAVIREAERNTAPVPDSSDADPAPEPKEDPEKIQAVWSAVLSKGKSDA